jgi:hypothetical protein
MRAGFFALSLPARLPEGFAPRPEGLFTRFHKRGDFGEADGAVAAGIDADILGEEARIGRVLGAEPSRSEKSMVWKRQNRKTVKARRERCKNRAAAF